MDKIHCLFTQGYESSSQKTEILCNYKTWYQQTIIFDGESKSNLESLIFPTGSPYHHIIMNIIQFKQ